MYEMALSGKKIWNPLKFWHDFQKEEILRKIKIPYLSLTNHESTMTSLMYEMVL